jgi:hypothetical protein
MTHLKIVFLVAGAWLLTHKTKAQCGLVSFTANPTCRPAPNSGSYQVTGTITFTSAPASGTIVISEFLGPTLASFSAPFVSPINYSYNVAIGNGGNITLFAYHSANPLGCNKSATYAEPRCCTISVPATTASVCESKTLTLNANSTTGGTFVWSGPGGFTSNQEDPVILNITQPKAGLYQVYLTNSACTSSTLNVTVTVNAKPSVKTIIHR